MLDAGRHTTDIRDLTIDAPRGGGLDEIEARHAALQADPAYHHLGFWRRYKDLRMIGAQAALANALLLEELAPGKGRERFELLRNQGDLCPGGTWVTGFVPSESSQGKNQYIMEDGGKDEVLLATYVARKLGAEHIPMVDIDGFGATRQMLLLVLNEALDAREAAVTRLERLYRARWDPGRRIWMNSSGHHVRTSEQMLGLLVSLELGEEGVEERYKELHHSYLYDKSNGWRVSERNIEDGSLASATVHSSDQLLALYVETRILRAKSKSARQAQQAIPPLLAID